VPWPIYVNIAAVTCCDSTEKVDSSCTLLTRILEVIFPRIDRRPTYALLLVRLRGRVSESHTHFYGYNTAWFVSDGTTGVSIVSIQLRLE
jgi:hypothetical protein